MGSGTTGKSGGIAVRMEWDGNFLRDPSFAARLRPTGMHSLVRRYIKTAIGFLITGLGLGLYMVVRRELRNVAPTPLQISAHTHVILVGFVMTMILGVALWLFPRPDKSDARYKPMLAEVSYWLLTAGTAARFIAELTRESSQGQWERWIIVLASAAQVLALVIFFHTMWSRIRAVGSAIREAKGERF
jgi:heme/copper-type cytochrome/quinol oxidase subunit 1